MCLVLRLRLCGARRRRDSLLVAPRLFRLLYNLSSIGRLSPGSHRAMSTSLPEVHSPQVQRIADEDPNYLSAYNICLKYEKEFAAFKDKLRSVRILGFLLLHAPSRGVRSEVTKCIHSRQDSSNLTGVGAFFERYVIWPCESSICLLYSLHVNLSSLVQSRSTEAERRNRVNTPQGPPLRP